MEIGKMITLKTIEQYTPLEIIDYVTPLLLAQNAKSQVVRMGYSDDNLTCAYRGNRGRKCPVGMVMSDEEYTELEAKHGKFKSAQGVCDKFGIPYNSIYRRLLSALQEIHDEHEPSEWADLLANIREAYA
jgi:hypothetical protein